PCRQRGHQHHTEQPETGEQAERHGQRADAAREPHDDADRDDVPANLAQRRPGEPAMRPQVPGGPHAGGPRHAQPGPATAGRDGSGRMGAGQGRGGRPSPDGAASPATSDSKPGAPMTSNAARAAPTTTNSVAVRTKNASAWVSPAIVRASMYSGWNRIGTQL